MNHRVRESQDHQENSLGQIQESCDSPINCLFSFLGSDQKTTYYVCEVDSLQAVRAAIEASSAPNDLIMEISEILPGNLPKDTLLKLFPDILYHFR